MIKRIRHSGIVIRDIETALRFYSGLLGLKIIVNRILTPKLEKELFGKVLNLTYIKLKVPRTKDTLELYHFNDTNCGISLDTVFSIGGYRHIAFEVTEFVLKQVR